LAGPETIGTSLHRHQPLSQPTPRRTSRTGGVHGGDGKRRRARHVALTGTATPTGRRFLDRDSGTSRPDRAIWSRRRLEPERTDRSPTVGNPPSSSAPRTGRSPPGRNEAGVTGGHSSITGHTGCTARRDRG